MTEDYRIRSVSEFIKMIKDSGEAVVKFEKKDGSARVMLLTLDFNRIPIEDHPKGTKKNRDSNLVTVYDLESRGWRMVNFKTCEWLESKPKDRESRMYHIGPKKSL